MAMKCGMVIPDFSPIEEVVTDKETSWLFPQGEREACVSLTMVVSKKIAEQMEVGNNARNYIVNDRQWRHNAELLLTLIE
jgi:hypothetical protein